MSSNAKIGYCFLALIFLSVLTIGRDGFTTLVEGANEDKIAVGTLRETFDSLPIVPGSMPKGAVRKFDKGVVTSYSKNMYVAGSMDHIVRSYESVLPQQGWERYAEKKVNGNIQSIKFCKSGIALIIGVVDSVEGGTVYGVQVVWDADANSSLHCPLA